MRIELFKYRHYQNGIFSLEPLAVSEQKSKSSSIMPIEKAVVDNSIDNLLTKASKNIRELFEELRGKIFEIDENITEKTTSFYVGYRVTKNFAEVHIGKNQLKIHLRPINYDDPLGKVDKIPEGYNWTMDRRVYLKTKEEFDYVFTLIEQSYKDVL